MKGCASAKFSNLADGKDPEVITTWRDSRDGLGISIAELCGHEEKCFVISARDGHGHDQMNTAEPDSDLGLVWFYRIQFRNYINTPTFQFRNFSK